MFRKCKHFSYFLWWMGGMTCSVSRLTVSITFLARYWSPSLGACYTLKCFRLKELTFTFVITESWDCVLASIPSTIPNCESTVFSILMGTTPPLKDPHGDITPLILEEQRQRKKMHIWPWNLFSCIQATGAGRVSVYLYSYRRGFYGAAGRIHSNRAPRGSSVSITLYWQ